jgi:hypothetical protein
VGCRLTDARSTYGRVAVSSNDRANLARSAPTRYPRPKTSGSVNDNFF